MLSGAGSIVTGTERKGETVKKKLLTSLILSLVLPGLLSGCGKDFGVRMESTEQMAESPVIKTREDAAQEDGAKEEYNGKKARDENLIRINPAEEITELKTGLSAVRYEGDYGFDTFLEQGGADTDAGVAAWLTSLLEQELSFSGTPFGCSTLSVENRDGGYLFGRNFDWNACNGLIVSAKPENGFASVSTVNLDFIRAGGMDISKLPDQMQALVSLYAPLDGLNEKGLAVSVNMIQDQAAIHQDTGKPDITTTTAVRLLLDQAEDVEEALELLEQYDFHSSMGMMVHLALADAGGRSVAVEYVDNEMIVTETPVVTNFYLAAGEKQGIGTAQSHTRYEILRQALEEHEEMTEIEMRDALDSVSKDNFGEFESTEWSIVMNQETKELIYYHREDYETRYLISVE